MVFFTRFFKKINLQKLDFKKPNLKESSFNKLGHFIRLSIAFLLLNSVSHAFAASSIVINQAELQPIDNFYALNADVDIDFDDAIEEAVNKGVALHFLIEFQVVKPWKYWFDDEIVTTSNSVSLSYHALSRQYLVNHGLHQKSFETLYEAKDALLEISNWKVLDKSLIEKGEVYNAALLIRLDQTKLPKAIQVDAIGSDKWNLTSQKYEWSLKDLTNKEPNNKEQSVKEPNAKDFNMKDLYNKDPNNKDLSNKELNAKDLNMKEPNLKDLNLKDLNLKDLNVKEQYNFKEPSGK